MAEAGVVDDKPPRHSAAGRILFWGSTEGATVQRRGLCRSRNCRPADFHSEGVQLTTTPQETRGLANTSTVSTIQNEDSLTHRLLCVKRTLGAFWIRGFRWPCIICIRLGGKPFQDLHGFFDSFGSLKLWFWLLATCHLLSI